MYSIFLCVLSFIFSFINVAAQEKQLLDSVARIYKPNIDALKKQINDLEKIKDSIRNTTNDLQLRKSYFVSYNDAISELKINVKNEKQQFRSIKKDIVHQVQDYYKSQDYYKYRKYSMVTNGLGIAFKVASMFLIVPAFATSIDENVQNNFLIASISSAVLGGGCFTLGAIYRQKYLHKKREDQGFKITAAPVISNQYQQLSYGVGFKVIF